MQETTYICLQELKSLISNDKRVLELKQIEEEMLNDSSANSAFRLFKLKESDYCDCLRKFGENNSLTLKAKEELLEAQKDMNKNPLISKYNESYKEVSSLYREIDFILLHNFKGNMICKNCHD